MDSQNVNAIMLYNIREVNGEKFLEIPLEHILTDKVIIVQNNTGLKVVQTPTAVVPVQKAEEPIKEIPTIVIPKEIRAVYKSTIVMLEDVEQYLKIVADCWEFRNSEFKKSILKKASAQRPSLNGVMFRMYDKEGDTYLTELVTSNMDFIKDYWKNGNKN